MHMIEVEGLTKAYHGVKAVDGLDLIVEKGEVFGFIGPNGAGKTTTIGMMVGLVEPTAGKCLVRDIDVTRNPREAKRVTGYLPDGVGFYGHLTARQNLRYFARFYKLNSQASEERITELLKYVGLAAVEKPVAAYSRGMKQRLGLAQALLNDPEVVFLDEPTNGLDPQGVIQFRNAIKDMAQKGKTIFFSSHNLEEVRHVCKTVGIISKGKMIAKGTPDEVRKKMSRDEHVNIYVKVKGDMPRLADPGILDAQYQNGTAIFTATADIRDRLTEEIYGKGARILEMRLEEKTLEDLFIESVYGGN